MAVDRLARGPECADSIQAYAIWNSQTCQDGAPLPSTASWLPTKERAGGVSSVVRSVTSLDKPWSLGEANFRWIVEALRRDGEPSAILEFGSGPSTVRLADAFPNALIVSVEHDPQYFAKTGSLATHHNLEERVRVELRPLEHMRVRGSWYRTYGKLERASGPAFRGFTADAVLVDGPPGWTGAGREGALLSQLQRIGDGAQLVLDDASRRAEARALRHWASVLDMDPRESMESRQGVKYMRIRRRTDADLSRGQMLSSSAVTGLATAGHAARTVLRLGRHPM